MRCNCENESCKAGHLSLGDCDGVATLPTTFDPICNDCAQYMPLEFIKIEGDQRLFEVDFDGKGLFTLAQLLETKDDNAFTPAELEAMAVSEAKVFGGGAQPIGRIKRVR